MYGILIHLNMCCNMPKSVEVAGDDTYRHDRHNNIGNIIELIKF